MDRQSYWCLSTYKLILAFIILKRTDAIYLDEWEDDDYFGGGETTRYYQGNQRTIDFFNIPARMMQYDMMRYYTNTMRYHPEVDVTSMLVKNYTPIDTDALDKYTWTNWLGEEENPLMDNAIAYNIITNPFIKDATYEGSDILNGAGNAIDQHRTMWYGPRHNQRKQYLGIQHMMKTGFLRPHWSHFV